MSTASTARGFTTSAAFTLLQSLNGHTGLVGEDEVVTQFFKEPGNSLQARLKSICEGDASKKIAGFSTTLENLIG